MRIENIDLKNFKQFQDFSIEFPSKDNEKNDFHVIVGKMGVGKSNFLESINWCLYGKEIFKNISKPTDEIVLNSNCLKTDGTHIVKVKLVLSDENYKYLIIRDSKFKVSNGEVFSLNETSLSFSKDMGLISKDNDAKSKINNLLPEDLRDHFFFNGERLDKYFDETQGEKISLVIKKMSGLDILESFKDILEKIENKYRKMIKVNEKNINEKRKLEKELENIKEQKKEKEKLLEKLQLDLDKTKKSLDEVNLKLDKLKEYEHIKKQIDTLKERLKELNNMKGNILKEKIQIVIEMGTLIFGWETVERVYHENSNIDVNYDYLPHEIIEVALNENKCPVCEKELDENHRNILEKYFLLDKDFIINAKDYQELTSRIQELETKRESLNNQLGGIEIKINGFKEKLKSIEKNISQIQTNELNKLYGEKKELETQIDQINQNIGSFKNQIEFFEKKEKEIENKIKELATQDSEKFIKKIDFVKALQQITLNTVINRKEEIKNEIVNYIKEYLDKLMWKKDLINEVEFNTNFSLNVYDKYGIMILNRLSGGEKSVLTLSFALAMHKASGVDAPIIIDRPLTNISGDPYDKLIEMFSKISKEKQIIVMITDKEYQQSVELLNKLASSIYILKLNENKEVYIADKYVNEVI